VSLADYIDDAAEVARPLDRPIVIGHSMGGLIAQKLAETGASRATVLLASAPPRWIVPVSWLLLRKQVKYLGPLLTRQALVPDRSDADALMFNRTPVADRAAFFARLVPESGRAGLELSIGSVAIREQRVTSPVLVVGAADDRFVVPRVARALARKYRATFRSYEGHAHHLMCEPGWERPASEIIQWMETSK
jgi:pimeloyl-ACP methyl ester carboxylesterase